MGKATTSKDAAQGTQAMRSLTIGFLAATAIGAISTANAADLDYGYLRGADEGYAEPVIDWSGVYIGGHGGYSSGAYGFGNAFQQLVARQLRFTTIEKEMQASTLLVPHSQRVDGGSYGALVGYNMQFDDVIVGVEADYTRFNVTGITTDEGGRTALLSDNYYSSYYLTGKSSTRLIDYGTLRARLGYSLGSFLPFVTGGVAIGRARIEDRVTVDTQYLASDPTTMPPILPTSTGDGVAKTKTVAGAAAGAGLEFAVTSNILLRGEYQYVLFNDFDGHKVNVNTVRGGAALKF